MNDGEPDEPGKCYQRYADAEEELVAPSETVYGSVEGFIQDAKVAEVDYLKPQEQGRTARCQNLRRGR